MTLTGVEMSTTVITRWQYETIIGTNPSHSKSGDDYPDDEVSWYDAVQFCNKLSDVVGLDRC